MFIVNLKLQNVTLLHTRRHGERKLKTVNHLCCCLALNTSTGESDEDDACVGPVSGPGGAEPQRSLEVVGHLRLQHRADPLIGGHRGCR